NWYMIKYRDSTFESIHQSTSLRVYQFTSLDLAKQATADRQAGTEGHAGDQRAGLHLRIAQDFLPNVGQSGRGHVAPLQQHLPGKFHLLGLQAKEFLASLDDSRTTGMNREDGPSFFRLEIQFCQCKNSLQEPLNGNGHL